MGKHVPSTLIGPGSPRYPSCTCILHVFPASQRTCCFCSVPEDRVARPQTLGPGISVVASLWLLFSPLPKCSVKYFSVLGNYAKVPG